MDVDDLYDLPLDRFVPERGVLARELRQAGQRDEAAEVASLRKPSVAAWAVNQLVRSQRRAVGELLEAGDALRAAQEDVLAGRGDARSLRAAADRERTAVETLTDAARGLLTSEGHELSPTIVDRVADTLNAAALDDEARDKVREGRLERELRHIGLGAVASAGAVPTASRGKASPAAVPGRRGPSEKAKRAEEERAEEERAKALSAARAAEREARRRTDRAERAAKLASDRRDRAAVALSEAEAALGEAEAERREAEDQLRDAERALGALEP